LSERLAMTLFVAFVLLVVIGFVRTILYANGMDLVHHWYDAPVRWVAKFIYELFH
jgi:hypothetical protein